KFMREFPDARTEPMNESHLDACRALLSCWAAHGDTTHDGEVNDAHMGTDVLRHKDHVATTTALTHFQDLGLTGMVVMVGDRLAGFTLGLALSPMQSMVLIEKTDPDFPGCPQYIFSEFCRTAFSSYPECNIGDDWGIPTLRFTKQSYRPIRLLNKYVLAREPLPAAVPLPTPDIPNRIPEPLPPAMTITPQATPDVSLRLASARDIDAILDVEQDCFADPEDQFSRRQIRALLAKPRATVYVAEDDQGVVAWAVSLIRQHRHWRSGRIYSIGVHSRARGRGIGRRLTERLLEDFRSRNILRVYLEVREDNATAMALYQALGFEPVRRLPAYYGPGADGLSCRVLLKPVSDPALP
ncbi:MAG: GNAT family N-acetyltransferase, partial [Phycisphaerales bacterium JB041]